VGLCGEFMNFKYDCLTMDTDTFSASICWTFGFTAENIDSFPKEKNTKDNNTGTIINLGGNILWETRYVLELERALVVAEL
jgi:hypothetical protein